MTGGCRTFAQPMMLGCPVDVVGPHPGWPPGSHAHRPGCRCLLAASETAQAACRWWCSGRSRSKSTRLVTLLFVVLRPVDQAADAGRCGIEPVDVEVDRLVRCCSSCSNRVDRLPMLLVAVLRPVDVEVDRLVTLLFVVLRPVDRLPMLLVAVLRPVDVEVDRLVTLLLVVLRPVDRTGDAAGRCAQSRSRSRSTRAR